MPTGAYAPMEKGAIHGESSIPGEKQESQKRWRQRYPSDQYQKRYRESHPEYVNRNRQLQKERNKKRKPAAVSMIVKTDALIFQPKDYHFPGGGLQLKAH